MILNAAPHAKFSIIHEMTQREDNLLNVRMLCEIAGVSRSGYYRWVKAAEVRQDQERCDEADFMLILEAYKFRGYAKGARGIHMRLLHQDPPVVMNPKKIRRLMKKYHLTCPVRKPNPYKLRAKEHHAAKVVPNLLNRKFRAHGPRSVLLTDITYLPRGDGKFSYLSVIMDAFTAEILAHVLSLSLEVDFVLQTVQMLLDDHGDELRTNALIHSDQGTHYCSHRFAEILDDASLRRSMSRKGTPWDNAPQESLFGHMKDEIHFCPSDRHPLMQKRIGDWVDYYNNDRYQWSLAKLSPAEFYRYVQTGIYPLPIPLPENFTDSIAWQSDRQHGEKPERGDGLTDSSVISVPLFP